MTEPKVRRDGKCFVCKKERPFNPQRGVPFEAYTRDPFCSAVCARKHYGTSLTTAAKAGRRATYTS